MDLYPKKKQKKNEEEEATIDARYESKNMIIYLMSDNDQNYPYIFSVSSYRH